MSHHKYHQKEITMEANIRNEQVSIVLRGGRLTMTSNGVEVSVLIRAEELCGAISGKPVKASLNIDINKK
jgi:hypothetical protein